MIIDYTYFTEKLRLPQVDNTEGRAIVSEFIDTYETEYLKKVLGYDLWKAFSDGIAGSGTPDQRWIDLLEGLEFTYLEKNNNWNGFEHEQNPIANYVYYRYMENKATDNSLVGTVVQAVDNNQRVNAVSKMVSAWNSMVDMNRILLQFLKANASVYPEWDDNGYGYWYYNTLTDCSNELFEKKNSLDL